MEVIDRLLEYIAVKTPSDEGNDSACPSSKEQFELANLLAGELRELGIEDVVVSEKCFVYAKVPATAGCEGARKLGLIAHMDTVSQFCDGKITPVLHEDYDGRDLVLGTSGRTLSVGDFPHLAELRGRTLFTSDGTTILGVDDKAGIAEIMGALERVLFETARRTVRCASRSRRTRRSAPAPATSTWSTSTRTSPTPWTATRRARSSTRTSTRARPISRSGASACTRAPQRGSW